MAGTTVDTRSFEAGIKRLGKLFSKESVVQELELVADELINLAKDSPIPMDTPEGGLASSDTVNVYRNKGEVEFGFNKPHAAFQDQPGRSGTVIVRPRVKKILFIPLTRKAKRTHQRGRNPNDEGLIRGKDYVLARIAKIPIKAYGSELGPNHYFSETLRRNKDWALETLATLLEEKLRRDGGVRS